MTQTMSEHKNKMLEKMSEFKNKVINKNTVPYLLISPAIIYYLLFWIRPVLRAIFESFTDQNGSFTFQNFINVFSEELFIESLINTALFATVSVILQYIIGLATALLLNKKFKGAKLLLFVAIIPMAIPPTAVAILWKTGFISYGWVNSILIHLHLISEPFSWLTVSGFKAILFLVLIDTWTVFPSVMIILLAGLQNLNKEFEEAGLVFGANKWQVIKDIVIPIIKPTIVTSIILRLISAIQVWMIAVMLFGHGRVPFLVERIAYYSDVVSGVDGSQKLALTYSVIVAMIVMITSAIYLKVSKRGMKGA